MQNLNGSGVGGTGNAITARDDMLQDPYSSPGKGD